MTKAVMGLAAVLTLVGCTQDNSPQDQRAYISQWRHLRDNWEAQEGNDLRRSKAEDDARAFFQTERPVTNWVGKVDGVKTVLGFSWVDVKNSGMTFMLRPPSGGEAMLNAALEKLNPGDQIVFSGTLKGELSITMSGALLRPEISVTLSRIERP